MVKSKINTTVDCWICGRPASDNVGSREHIIKNSDLTLTIPVFSKESIALNIADKIPAYFCSSKFDGSFRGLKAKSSSSDSFKYEKTICKDCNSARTSRHDNAWKACSEYFFENYWTSHFSKIIIYEDESINLINIGLYFAKLLGCRLVHENLTHKYNIKKLAEAILNNQNNSKSCRPYLPEGFFISFYNNFPKYILSSSFDLPPIHGIELGPCAYYEDFDDHFDFYYFAHNFSVKIQYFLNYPYVDEDEDHCPYKSLRISNYDLSGDHAFYGVMNCAECPIEKHLITRELIAAKIIYYINSRKYSDNNKSKNNDLLICCNPTPVINFLPYFNKNDVIYLMNLFGYESISNGEVVKYLRQCALNNASLT